jgi:hypothetical protein
MNLFVPAHDRRVAMVNEGGRSCRGVLFDLAGRPCLLKGRKLSHWKLG